jgi:hypothetical protein
MFDHLDLVVEGLLEVKLSWATFEEDPLHVCTIIS